MAHEHLHLEREATVTERHKRQFGGNRWTPDNPRSFGGQLGRRFHAAKKRLADTSQADIGGFDDRKLLKLTLREGEGKPLPAFDHIPGVQTLSQEDTRVVLAFATEDALAEVELRLATLATDGAVTRKELFYVLEDFDHWTPKDRTGQALKAQGFPNVETFVLDIELWPQTDMTNQRAQLVEGFEQWLSGQNIEQLDKTVQPSLVMVRVRSDQAGAEQLLRHRDVRTVDLPPRTGVDVRILLTDINTFPDVPEPATNAPMIGVLDSGVTASHGLLGAAVGDAQGYLEPRRDAHDDKPWHGTFVAGLALYGDVAKCVHDKQFIPELRVLSGKVFNDDGADQTRFVENAVEEAVRELNSEYGCKVFNLSYGDGNKIYDGRHLRGLAYTLDRLTRELSVLFVVPTGNLNKHELPDDAKEAFPHYLLDENARLLDPAPALNALTIGGLTQHEATRNAQNHDDSIEDRPIARTDQPFPLTRSGFSVNRAVKPDLVEHAGNVAVTRNNDHTKVKGLGVVSLNGGFASGAAFAEDIGTSYAAPVVARQATRILSVEPAASPNLLRALLAAHARWPEQCEELLNAYDDPAGRERLLRLVGYGQVDERALYRSLDDTVTMLAEESVTRDNHHFYEIPLPDSFRSKGRRTREVTVALAYSPDVRTTRLDYVATKLKFELVMAASLDEVEQSFTRGRDAKDLSERSTGRWLSSTERGGGTLQVSRWCFRDRPSERKRLFVVVTRQESTWASADVNEDGEPYALAVVVADRQQENVSLYAELKVQLQVRAQARVRARVTS